MAVLSGRESETLIQDFFTIGRKPIDEIIDEVWLKKALLHENVYGTGDQLRGFCELFKGSMSYDKLKDQGRTYANRVSIFNSVLQFAYESLDVNGTAPIVKPSQMLNWHHITSILGEDIFTSAYCAAEEIRAGHSFDYIWTPYLRADDEKLLNLYKNELVDVHNHLKGSSLNFDLSWLYLMNHISRQTKKFSHLSIRLKDKWISGYEEHNVGLYLSIIKAAAIRLYLWQEGRGLQNYINDNWLSDLLQETDSIRGILYAKDLQDSLNAAIHTEGKMFVDQLSMNPESVDYAIEKSAMTSTFVVLKGEREILSNAYKKIFDPSIPTIDSQRYAELLLIYLTIKTQFRQELIQLNNVVGFENFSQYEGRKEIFLPDGSVYERLLPNLAVAEFICEGKNRYMETRITPKEKLLEGRKQLKKLDKNITEEKFVGSKLTIDSFEYVYHFIKTKDQTKTKLWHLHCRHYALRNKVKNQAQSIARIVVDNRTIWGNSVSNRPIGIDAANSEILTRPEVFAQAFRYLKGVLTFLGEENKKRNFGYTYHIGEDFWDVADGLRALDELITFCDIKKGDRLGHGLVLGVDVEKYYEDREYAIVLPRQVVVDNLCWLYNKIQCPIVNKEPIKELFEREIKRLYDDDSKVVPIRDYYKAMLLRGDNPEYYLKGNRRYTSVDDWYNYDLANINPKYRNKEPYVKLLYDYHYSAIVKQKGQEMVELKIEKWYVDFVRQCQWRMLARVRRNGLAIECNPTSNLRIGEMRSYAHHPILSISQKKINLFNPLRRVSLSINTDDKGVFATSLEREYALMMLSMGRKYEDGKISSDALRWADKMRKNGISQKFHK